MKTAHTYRVDPMRSPAGALSIVFAVRRGTLAVHSLSHAAQHYIHSNRVVLLHWPDGLANGTKEVSIVLQHAGQPLRPIGHTWHVRSPLLTTDDLLARTLRENATSALEILSWRHRAALQTGESRIHAMMFNDIDRETDLEYQAYWSPTDYERRRGCNFKPCRKQALQQALVELRRGFGRRHRGTNPYKGMPGGAKPALQIISSVLLRAFSNASRHGGDVPSAFEQFAHGDLMLYDGCPPSNDLRVEEFMRVAGQPDGVYILLWPELAACCVEMGVDCETWHPLIATLLYAAYIFTDRRANSGYSPYDSRPDAKLGARPNAYGQLTSDQLEDFWLKCSKAPAIKVGLLHS